MSRELVDRFYTSFSNRDSEAMVSCYDDDIVFEDPAFGLLRGEDARDMWRMLIGRSKDFSLTYTILEASESSARVNWIADYTFSTGRAVRNDITAEMKISNGLIVDHRDTFDVWKWSRQALGLPGLLLGWSPPLRKKVTSEARHGLREFQRSTG